MNKNQRIVMFALWGLLLCGLAVMAVVKWGLPLLSRTVAAATPPPVMYPVAEYELTDQHGQPLSSKSLAGKPYVASFMFTRCTGVCPVMNTAIVNLHRDLPAEFQFVSFTVDPAHDTVQALKDYAAARGVQPGRWHFLTGDIAKLRAAALGMKLQDRDWPQMHSPRLVLIDATGNVRGTYDSRQEEAVKQLITDAKAMLSAKP